MVIFTADNGPESMTPYIKETYDHDSAYSLRGMKRDSWEGGHREVFISKYPNLIQEGQENNSLIGHTDVMATLADIIGFEMPNNTAEDSYSFLDAFNGKESLRPKPLIHSIQGKSNDRGTVPDAFAIRTQEWKLLNHQGAGSYNYAKGIRKITPPLTAPDAPGQLYNIKDDKGEMNNLWYENPEIVKKLQKQLELIIAE